MGNVKKTVVAVFVSLIAISGVASVEVLTSQSASANPKPCC